MQIIKPALLACLSLTAFVSHAQLYNYDYGGQKDHVGIVADINQNLGYSLIEPNGTKPAFAPFARAGVYLRHNWSPRLYFRGALMVGNGNFSYTYNKTFQPTSDTTFPIGLAGKESISIPVI